MKYWLTGAFSLLIASGAWAQNYNIVSSPSLKLNIWIDNVKSNAPASWCASELPLRIVANGSKDPAVLNEFLPRVGSLLAKQCAKLTTIRWQMNDGSGQTLAKGSASKAQKWAVQVTPEAAAPIAEPATASVPEQAPAVAPETLSPPADTTPWSQFSLMDGCHFRTWWRSGQTHALFVPAKDGVTCGSDGWLSGESQIERSDSRAAKSQRVIFLQGFPVAGLSAKALGRDLQITTVNNERMVLSDEKSPQSWMLVPYAPMLNGWQADGTVAIQISPAEASDESALKARLDEVRKVWSPYLANAKSLSFRLVPALHPQLRDPAAGAFRTIN
ncbi:hypothetical protein [Erwinia oleae]|uniref:hypothetical protein n=1 Tax=Erwinia oleae TaxID=796334 RepID=UPI000557E0F1|nr:hypothetical protein [Erwinia oleae]